MKSAVVSRNRTVFTESTRLDQIPDESFDFLVALVSLKAEQKLKKKVGCLVSKLHIVSAMQIFQVFRLFS